MSAVLAFLHGKKTIFLLVLYALLASYQQVQMDGTLTADAIEKGLPALALASAKAAFDRYFSK